MDRDRNYLRLERRTNEERALKVAVASLLHQVDMTAVMRKFPDVNTLVARMLASLPDVHVEDPPIGSCFSAPALARWKELSRQAIDQQRRAGRIFGVMINHRWLYPAVQFDIHGKQSRKFAALLENHGSMAKDPVTFAVWLETHDSETGVSPRVELQNAPISLTPKERFFDGFVPTIINPPPYVTEPDKLERDDGGPS